jgi:hypothetical protein
LLIYALRARHQHKYGEIQQLTPYGSISWWVLLLMNGPITLGVTLLFVGTWFNTYENKSTLEAMKQDT